MPDEIEYVVSDVGYGWWNPTASKMQDMQIRDDPKKGLHNVRIFICACIFYGRHIQNFTYSSALLTDLIKKTNPWRWIDKEEACFQKSKKKISSTNCLRVPHPKGQSMLIPDACDGGRGRTLYQWHELNPAELSRCQYHTSGLKRDGWLKHEYRANEWRLVPFGHWNWKWHQALPNYSTHDQKILPRMLMPSSQSCQLGTNPIVRLCHRSGKAQLKTWWTYLSQFGLTVHNI